jgi:hypothetical protein
MKILKTYARVFVRSLDESLPTYVRLVGRPADIRFGFEAAELASVGDFLLIAGPPADIDKYRGTVGPVIVDDLDALTALLHEQGAVVTGGPSTSATGTYLYARHDDGADIEYVQWTDDLVAAIVSPHT